MSSTALLNIDEIFMREALAEAQLSLAQNEVPVGAVLVYQGKILARAHNQMISTHNATAHAEIELIRKAGILLQNYRLIDTTLYVTLEPCIMCTGAIIHARIGRVVYGAKDYKTGAVESAFQLLQHPKQNHYLSVTAGVLKAECSAMLSAFFAKRRQEIKAMKALRQQKQS